MRVKKRQPTAMIAMLLLAVLLTLALNTSARAFNEPEAFRGVKWGASQEETLAILKDATRPAAPKSDQPACVSKTRCIQQAKLGTVRVQYSYVFRDDRFVGVLLSFSTIAYPKIRERFIELYGPPSKESTEEFKTTHGYRVPNETLRWTGERIAISLQQFGRAPDKGAAEILTTEELKRRGPEGMR